MSEKIVIIGFGWVGQANALALLYDDYAVSYFDTQSPEEHYERSDEYKKIRKLSTALEVDGPETYYLVCVGDRVDEAGNQDIRTIEKALDSLTKARGTVILRSTVLPSSLDHLKFDIYVPEFLHEKAAVKECINPEFIVIGKKDPHTKTPAFIETWRKRSGKFIECTPRDASHIKYMSNLWNALRVGFTNEFGSSIEEPADRKALAHIDTVVNFLFENGPYKRYGRSFGGHCLPKDVRAYVKWCEDNGRDNVLLKGLLRSNDLHLEKEKKYPHLPEWFSEWSERTGSGWVALQILGKSIKRNIFHPIAALKRRKTVEYRLLIKD